MPVVVGTRPPKRSSHAAVCLGSWGSHPQLLIMEGRNDQEYNSMDDMWMLDLTSWRWTEVEQDSKIQLIYKHGQLVKGGGGGGGGGGEVSSEAK